ncbi:MAG: hypothetical protein EOO41_01090 [Methanobacteriota archaeon]|nr:MAG: hypothetical protein EOO41_01090 [Euryarchaeota archaeon]
MMSAPMDARSAHTAWHRRFLGAPSPRSSTSSPWAVCIWLLTIERASKSRIDCMSPRTLPVSYAFTSLAASAALVAGGSACALNGWYRSSACAVKTSRVETSEPARKRCADWCGRCKRETRCSMVAPSSSTRRLGAGKADSRCKSRRLTAPGEENALSDCGDTFPSGTVMILPCLPLSPTEPARSIAAGCSGMDSVGALPAAGIKCTTLAPFEAPVCVAPMPPRTDESRVSSAAAAVGGGGASALRASAPGSNDGGAGGATIRSVCMVAYEADATRATPQARQKGHARGGCTIVTSAGGACVASTASTSASAAACTLGHEKRRCSAGKCPNPCSTATATPLEGGCRIAFAPPTIAAPA